MALETIPNYNDLFIFMLNDAMTMNATQCDCNGVTMDNTGNVSQKACCDFGSGFGLGSLVVPPGPGPTQETARGKVKLGVQGRKKRRRRPQVYKNKEEAETQRMTHITVERNRRKQMNEHLSVLRSLMPESFSQRGDQASIVGGAIEFVKELEQLVHTLEAHKLLFLNRSAQSMRSLETETHEYEYDTPTSKPGLSHKPPFQTGRFPDYFFTDPQNHIYNSQICNNNKYSLRSKVEEADMEVTLIETHTNIRILLKKYPNQLSKLVSGLQILRLNVLHLNVTSLDPLVLYSISAKVEEGCQLTTVDGIAEAVHHMLRIIEEDALLSLSC